MGRRIPANEAVNATHRGVKRNPLAFELGQVWSFAQSPSRGVTGPKGNRRARQSKPAQGVSGDAYPPAGVAYGVDVVDPEAPRLPLPRRAADLARSLPLPLPFPLLPLPLLRPLEFPLAAGAGEVAGGVETLVGGATPGAGAESGDTALEAVPGWAPLTMPLGPAAGGVWIPDPHPPV